MATLWIDNNMVIRWHPNWPVEPKDEGDEKLFFKHNYEVYQKSLAQAKAESLPVPRVEFVNAITGRQDTKLKEAIEYIDNNYKPDTFIDVPVSITTYQDQMNCPHGCPLDCWASMNGGKCHAETDVKVARLKPANQGINWPTNGPRSPWEHDDGTIKPINQNVAIGWQAGDPPDSIFTREDVRAMVEQARSEALKDIRARILEEFANNYDGDSMAYTMLIRVLDKLNVK